MSVETLDAPVAAATAGGPPHPLREFWSYFSANRGAVAGLVVIVLVLLMAIFANVIAPHSPYLTNNAAFLRPPFWQEGGSLTYPLGTDAIGRDILSRLFYGARLSLVIGIAVVAIAIAVGIVLGLVAGFFRGLIEITIMRIMDIILTMPSLLLAIVIVAILGPGMMNAMLAVAIVVLPHYVRITRAAVIAETSKEYVTAARVSGARTMRLMFSEVLPNCTAPLIVQATLGISTAILDAAALGFLGLGRAASDARMGHDAGRCARIRAARLVGGHFAWPDDPHHRSGVQPAWRRTARCPRSETEALTMPLLDIQNLSVEFPTSAGTLRAVDHVSLTLEEGEILGVVGESGSGKSVTMMALMGLVAYPGRITAERLSFDGRDLLTMSDGDRRRLTGKDVAMIFQEPTTSLNPCFTIGFQLAETLKKHEGMDSKAAKRRSIELLEQVGIPAAESRLKAYPHQMSGGMNQRVMIAMAISCNPRLLIADEPTTALDVTIQAQILDLLMSLQRERNMALVLITHNMGVVAETAQRIMVMYGGQIMEERKVEALFEAPQHPYSAALLAALPERSVGDSRLATIPGMVPGLHDRPKGCLFSPRCAYATDHSRIVRPDLRAWQGGQIRCHYPLGDPARESRRADDSAPAREMVR